jgi:hypothetical protein
VRSGILADFAAIAENILETSFMPLVFKVVPLAETQAG